jgi:signal transduction histidine kinase
MRRRILLAMIGVTILSTVLLSIPLVIIISNREKDDAFLELDRVAARTAANVPSNVNVDPDRINLPDVDDAIDIAVYDRAGRRISGRGPDVADTLTHSAFAVSRSSVIDDERVVARPITLGRNRLAVIRVSEPLAETSRKVREDILWLVLIDLGAIVVAGVVGWAVATRLVRPLRVIRDDAVHLGHGDFSIQPARSGVAELDETAEALAETARRLDGVMRREREFTTNASHQLRTPVASMRLVLEGELMRPRPDRDLVVRESLEEVDRLEGTIQTLLAFARDRPLRREVLDVAAMTEGIRSRWSPVLEADGRRLEVAGGGDLAPHLSAEVLSQIVDVLIGNAVAHGEGTVSVAVAERGSNLTVAVSDEGVVNRDPAELFVRRHSSADNHGVGLALARTLAEAEGGRLSLASVDPTTFVLVLPDLAA